MKKRELLFSLTADDFVFKAKRGTGAGGQKKNKTSSAIQCFHPPSGSMSESEDAREQSVNRKRAFRRCCETLQFKAWLQMKIDAALGNIKIEETNENGKSVTRLLNHEEVK